MEVTIRRLATLEEYAAAEQLLQDCWQTGPLEAIPTHLMLTIQNEAGLVLGAFTSENRMVGFLLGFLSREGATLKHHSHMTGVHPEFRDRGIAYRLKLAQRDFVIAEGLDLCTWTFDPLECRNAILNIAKLGATSHAYKRNVYGALLGQLNTELPTDRLLVQWEVRSERVCRCVETGQHVEAPISNVLLSEVTIRESVPDLVAIQESVGQRVIGVHIPTRFQKIKQARPDAAMAWRMGIREFFEKAFSAGYSVVNITSDRAFPEMLSVYTLTLP